MTEEQIRIRDAQRSKEGFNQFIADPQTRSMLAMIPAGEQQDALILLLEAAYSSGFKTGGGNMAATFLEAIFKKDNR